VEWLTLAALGGALGLDDTAVGQTMVSRPIVAGALAGLVAGSLPLGFLLGVFLECVYASRFKVGGARVPDATTAAVIGATVAALEPTAGGLALGLVAALLFGEVGGRVTMAFRRWVGRLVPLQKDDPMPPGRLGRLHATLVTADFVRGAAFTGLALTTIPLWRALSRSWPLDADATLGMVGVAAATALGVLWGAGPGGRTRVILMGLGLFVSLAFGVR